MKNKIETRDVNFWYGDFHALKGISMDIEEKSVIAFIGPSGCGKSTFLRLLNRMNDLIPDTRLTGEIRIDGQDIYGKGVQVDELRKNVGMVFQRPNPFPKSIFENVAYGLRVNGITDNAFIRQRVEETLKGAALWDEVKDKLKVSAYVLSGGQQQRLCIARAMAVSPSVLLMDEPLSNLDAKLRNQMRAELINRQRVSVIIRLSSIWGRWWSLEIPGRYLRIPIRWRRRTTSRDASGSGLFHTSKNKLYKSNLKIETLW